ncbi:hypothetical protein [Haloarchaeobius salinus]|uniref:hypothetical protein n=1 Tax=Haloarchaeobius salinus TaxID=1198298 RepID=UPI00210ADF6A|nr:hypothetical protein [Haloarchaeobius salinus]
MNAPPQQSGPPAADEDEPPGDGMPVAPLEPFHRVDKRSVVLGLWLLLALAVLYGLLVGP